MNSNCLEGMACPLCGQEDKLLILAKMWVAMTDDGTDPFDDALNGAGDVEYEDDSRCVCPVCDHSGIVREFREEKGELESEG